MSAILGFTGPPDAKSLDRMAATLAHRGRREAGRIETPAISLLALSHDDETRVATSENHALALAGHVYHPALSARPAEDLLRLWIEQGSEFVEQLEGAFVLALWDGATLTLVRDGVGHRTIYYALVSGRLVFAIEPKGVAAHPQFTRELNPSALAQYLTFSYVPGANTMLRGLHELPPGHTLTFREGTQPVINRFFRFEEEAIEEHRTDEEWSRIFTDELDRAIDRRMPTGDSPAVFLSGGIDSSIVTAALAARTGCRPRTYAIHFGKDYPNELEFAGEVARHCGTEHEEVLVRPNDFIPKLRKIIWHLDDPIGDPVAMPNFELSAHVAREHRHVFNGEGGDPCFGGPKNLPMLLHHWYGGVERSGNFREEKYLESYQRAYEELDRLLTPEFRSHLNRERDLVGVLSPLFRQERPALFLSRLRMINLRTKAAHLILPKVERMTGAWGLTPLSPLFDERMVRLSFRLPPRLILHRGIEKVILKQAFRDRLPERIIARPKSGMRVPVHYWFQKDMKKYARDLLSPRRLRTDGIFDEHRVKELLDYQKGELNGRFGLRLWMLITFEIWRRIVIEGEAI